MAEEYCGGVNWWESPSPTTNRSNRFDGVAGGGAASSTSSTTAAYGWLTDGSTSIDINDGGRSALETVDASKIDGSSSLLVGLGLSSQPLDWNQQQLLNAEKSDNSFRSMLQEGVGINTGPGPGPVFCAQQQLSWRDQKLFPSQTNEDSTSEFKQLGHNNQAQFSPSCSSMESTVTCQGHGFQLENTSSSSSSVYSTNILQGFIAADQQQQQQQQQAQLSYQQQNYFGMGVNNNDQSWPTKVPQFLRATSPKQIQQQQQQQQQLQFTNNAPYWNASNNPTASMIDVRPSFFSSLQNQLPMQTFEEKPKNILEVRETTTTTAKKSTTLENNNKRGRNEGGSSTLPPFKVRKEKMGDRITALQQLVSPFGKTDTASVLSEAIEYIKFLHEQVSVLSTPYLKSGASCQQPNNDKAKMDTDGPKQDLRSRGLCLVPISSTFPVTHETTVDFWTPTFGGTFR